MTQTVIGLFDSPDAAHVAEERLARRGIDRSAFHLASQEAASGASATRQGTPSREMASGIRDFFNELFGTGHSEEAAHYSEAVRRGGVVLAVDLPDGAPVEPVRQALVEAGAVDIDERIEEWRRQGYTTAYSPQAQAPTQDQVRAQTHTQAQAQARSAEEAARERSTVLPVIQEKMEIGKREVGKGTVRVYARTVETPVHETVELREEHATIERRPVDRPVSEAELKNLGDKTIEVREMAEKAVVTKTARVVEEVEIGKEVTRRTETIEDTLRHTEVEVERGVPGGMGAAAPRPYEDYEPDYRKDFQIRYGGRGGSYEDYAPAYRYGHALGGDPRYQGQDWAAIEPEARRDWERHHPESTWERFKLAIRHGWERVTGRY